MGYDVKGDIEAILEAAKAPGADPAVRYALISTLSRYQEQLRQLNGLKQSIDEHGTMLTMKDTYGKTVLMENPAIKSYAKLTQQANTTAAKLLKLYRYVKN